MSDPKEDTSMSRFSDLWRCWNLGEISVAEWTAHLERPHYCKPANGHKDCGWVRIIDLEEGTE
jgi:hypothetical protein